MVGGFKGQGWVKLFGRVKAMTDKALLLEEFTYKLDMWVPYSQIMKSDPTVSEMSGMKEIMGTKSGMIAEIYIPEWLVDRKLKEQRMIERVVVNANQPSITSPVEDVVEMWKKTKDELSWELTYRKNKEREEKAASRLVEAIQRGRRDNERQVDEELCPSGKKRKFYLDE